MSLMIHFRSWRDFQVPGLDKGVSLYGLVDCRKFARRWLRIAILLILALLVTQTASPTKELSLVPSVDERVELLSIIFHLAGADEYNMVKIRRYESDIDKYFEPYKSHPVVLMAKKLRKTRQVACDAVMKMAVSLSAPPDLTLVVPLTETVSDKRWGKEDASAFAAQVGDFYKITKFNSFFCAHKELYSKCISRLQNVVQELKLPWYQNFYGELPSGKFNLLLGVANGPMSYGPMVIYPDGHEDLFSIIGCGTVDKSGDPIFDKDDLSTIVHEFNHSLMNPLVVANRDKLACAKPVFDAVSKELQRQNYVTCEIMLYESMVRAGEIMYMESTGADRKAVLNKIRDQQIRGFYWTGELCALLRQYQSEREKYPTLRAFMPKVVEFFKALGPHIKGKIASFKSNYAHVTAISPFKNHSQSVDPKIGEVIVSFDKTLNPGSISVCSGYSGQKHNPVLPESVKILPGNKSLKLRVKLKRHWRYELIIYSPSFCTEDRYPLVDYTIDFKTL